MWIVRINSCRHIAGIHLHGGRNIFIVHAIIGDATQIHVGIYCCARFQEIETVARGFHPSREVVGRCQGQNGANGEVDEIGIHFIALTIAGKTTFPHQRTARHSHIHMSGVGVGGKGGLSFQRHRGQVDLLGSNGIEHQWFCKIQIREVGVKGKIARKAFGMERLIHHTAHGSI